ncbi:MAG: hypothetical protein GTO51_07155 [Candidatus Latescibacteria bacterium]|nr:hypothetical protein [Candidatus Latescibacterota bacterium]NIM22271.1 hypothetical protein [Candidatus Latescibacterota bacterium]NIM65750.1 hypothetical protein [Candidatus Latescibacterota bacterium]NIO02135.1 hypothetical protein [Candidatus Latescibacterota bacterium]NIO28967.1 hypothetical protein [Candidatus Latescibacterota bacterium]
MNRRSPSVEPYLRMQRFLQKNRLLQPVLLAALTPAYYAMPWERLPGSAEAWGIPFLFVYALLLPGAIVRRALVPRCEELITRISLSALCGLLYFLFVSFIWALFAASIGSLETYFPVTLIPIVSLPFFAGESASGFTKREKALRAGTLVTLIVCAVVFFLVWRSGVPISYLMDTFDHVGYVSEMQETGEIFPTSAFYVDAGENGKDIRKGLLHVLYAFSTGYLGIEALACLEAWNAFFAVLLFLSIYAVAFAFFGNTWIATISSAFLLLWLEGGISEESIRESFYSNRFGLVFFLFLLVFIFRFLEKREKRALVLCAFFGFAASAVHIFYAVLVAFAVALIAVWKVCFSSPSIRAHLSRTFLCGTAAMIGIAPYAIFRFFTAYRQPNELHKEIQRIVYVGGGLFIADPSKLFLWSGPLGLAAFLTAFALWKYRKQYAGLGYLLAACFTIPLVLMNPILLPPLHKAMTYLVLRLPSLFPFYMLLAYFLVDFIRPNNARVRRSALEWTVFSVLSAAILLQLIPAFKGTALSGSALREERAKSYLGWKTGLDFLHKRLPPGSVIASDPITSYTITAFTPHYVVCTLDQHAPPGDQLLEKRMQAGRDILSPFVSLSETASILEETNAKYVVLNNRIPPQFILNFWSVSRDVFPLVHNKFASHPDLFELLYDKDNFFVYQWRGNRPAGLDTIPYRFTVDSIPDTFVHFGSQAGDAVLSAFRFEKQTTERGKTFAISLLWRGDRDYPFRNYVVSIRFDHEEPGLPFGGKPFPKIVRKAKEALSSMRLRFRQGHKIQNGFLNPDAWPDGMLVLDEASIRVPGDITPGSYTVSVKLHALAAKPNYYLRDIFFDDDIYQGVAIGSVTIQ